MTTSKTTTKAATPKMTKSEKQINDFTATTLKSSAMRLEKSKLAAARFANTKDTDDKAIMMLNQTHATYDARLADMSLQAKQQLYKLFTARAIDATCNRSRAHKLRLQTTLEAIANNDMSRLEKPLRLALPEIAKTRKKVYIVKKLQHMMNHTTTTQAEYFKRFVRDNEVAKVTQLAQDASEIELDYDNLYVQALLKLAS